MTTLDDWRRRARAALDAAGVDSPRLDADLLAGRILGLDRPGLLAQGGRDLAPAEQAGLDALLARRLKREPLSHILGTREFWSLDFEVDASTLDPRPDTETLVEAVLDRLGPRGQGALDILDLGTGTGCILAALLHECPGARGLGVDRSPGAVALARRNFERLGLARRAEVRQGDWFAGLDGTFDVVVSNPPYLAREEVEALEPEVRLFEPWDALVGGEDGLACYRLIFAGVSSFLKAGAVVAVEIGVTQADAVLALAHEAGLSDPAVRPDLGGRPRVVLSQKL